MHRKYKSSLLTGLGVVALLGPLADAVAARHVLGANARLADAAEAGFLLTRGRAAVARRHPAVIAALDAVFGGLRAYLERIFDSKVFVVSFVFNVLVAALIVWVGDQLGVGTQLSTAIIVVLGIRIFGNAAALRRRLFGA